MKKLLIAGMFISVAYGAMADFTADFQGAKKLFDTNKNKEAYEAFKKISSEAPTPQSKAESLSYAAKAIGRDKSQYDAAMGAAKEIGVREIAVTTQMNIMTDNGKIKELYEAFKDEDLSKWPEVYQLQGYSLRGQAERLIPGQQESAKNDLLKAIGISGSDLRTKIINLACLNDVYGYLKDHDNVIKTSSQILEMKDYENFYPYASAILMCSKAQLAQGKYNDAVETIKLINAKSGVYKCQALIINGDICAAQGKKDEAAAFYKEAVGMEKGQAGNQDSFIEQAQKKLDELGK